MANCRKDSKHIHFSLLDYDIKMYTHHREELERGRNSSKKLTNGTSFHSGDVHQSQADIANVLEIQRVMARLISVFMEP